MLSSAATAGIAIGIIGAFALGAAALAFFVWEKRTKKSVDVQHSKNGALGNHRPSVSPMMCSSADPDVTELGNIGETTESDGNTSGVFEHKESEIQEWPTLALKTSAAESDEGMKRNSSL